MTHFEYLAIAFSLVFSFSAVRVLGGLPHAIQDGRRYWVHLFFVALQLVGTALAFWGLWFYRGVEWSFPSFLLVLAIPGLVHFSACALIPERADAIQSWREHYYDVHTRYFVGLALLFATIGAADLVVLGSSVMHPIRGVQASLVVAGIVGAAFSRPRVHAGLAGAVGLLVLLVVAITLQPE